MPKRFHSIRSAKRGRTTHRRKLTSMMSRKAGRVFTKGRRRTRVSVKGRSNGKSVGGYLDKHVNYKFGHRTKISPSFIAKARKAVAAKSFYNCESMSPSVCAFSGCTYAIPPPTYQITDVIAIAAKFMSVAVGAVDPTIKYNIDGVSADYRLNNPNNVAMNVRCYECTPRFDIPYQYGGSATNVQHIIQEGFTDIGDTLANTEITSTLFMNMAFTARFKIENVSMHKLAAGENKLFTISQPTSHVMNMARWIEGPVPTAQSLIYLARGLSKFLVFQYWGEQVHSAANNFVISTAGILCNVITQMKYEYSSVQQQISFLVPKVTQLDGSGASYALATTISDPTVVVEQTGVSTAAV